MTLNRSILFVLLSLLVGAGNGLAQSKGYDVTYYNATIHLDRQHDSLWGVVTMQATADSSISAIEQMRKYLAIDSVTINGLPATATKPDTSGIYYASIQNPIASGSKFSVTTFFHGHGVTEDGGGGWGGVTDKSGMMFAMGVGFTCPYTSCTRHWLPCYDLPDDKADSLDLTFITPDSDVVASNGLLVSELFLPNGQREFHWHVSHPIASYLLTFAVGPFQKLTIPNTTGIPFSVYAFAKDSAAMGLEMRSHVTEALDFFDSLFGEYHFEKVGYVLTNFGSMEHQTMISLDPSALDTTSTTAQHELSHQWWGDWVTCKTFDDAWLNEGFATFSESLLLERFNGKAAYWTRQHSNISGAISSGSSNALYGAPNRTKPRNNYPYPIIYQKGAAVLGMLRYYLGDSLFFTALRNYGTAHAYSTATSDDLWHSFESTTGQDLGWFFKKWVFGIWYPQLKLSWTRSQNSVVKLVYQQTQDSVKYGYFRMPVIVEGIANGKTERIPIWLDSAQFTTAWIPFSFTPDTILTDPDGVLLKKMISTTFAGVAPSPSAKSSNVHLRIQENPIRNGILSLSLTSDHLLGNIRISLCTETGAILSTLYQRMVSEDHLQLHIGIDSLSSGTYFALYQDDSGIISTAKFTMQR